MTTTKQIERIGQGRPLTEAITRGSLNYFLRQIKSAFYKTFPDIGDIYWVAEVFADHLIIEANSLPRGQYFQVAYTQNGDDFEFANREAWAVVELTYQPASLTEQLREKQGKKIRDVLTEGRMTLAEAVSGHPRKIHVDVAQADVINENARRYPRRVLIEAAAEARHHLRESLSQGRAILLGEDSHPSSKGQPPKFLETIIKWTDIWFDYQSGWVKASGEMIENSLGKDAIVTMDAGVFPGVSLRGRGDSHIVTENGHNVEEIDWLRFSGIDFEMQTGFADAGVQQLENKRKDIMADKTKTDTPIQESKVANRDDVMTLIASGQINASDIRMAFPDLAEDLRKDAERERELAEKKAQELHGEKLAEMRELADEELAKLRGAAGVDDDTADLATTILEQRKQLQELQAEKQQREVTEYVEKAVGELKSYSTDFRESLRKAVENEKPATVAEAKAAVARQREIFDPLIANLRLQTKGRGVSMLGPVLESETGVPEFARASFEIAENLRSKGYGKTRGLHKKDTLYPSEKFAVKYLELFDTNFKTQLMQESKRFQEAETTADLNLPYSVLRAIAEEAYPDLIAANVFDFDIMTASPTNLFYEVGFSGETGYSNAVVGNNNVNAVVVDTWYTLAAGHKNLQFDTLVMEPSGGGTAFVYGVDYVIDLENGRYLILSTGSMAAATNYDFDYSYLGTRKGEGVGIERAKTSLSNMTISAAAVRLAMQITDEAVVFSQSQLGWDAVLNSMNLLIKELRKNTEKNLLMKGLNQVITVANNSGGTWNSATDSLQKFVEYILNAKTKVENREYMPDSIVMSKTRGNALVLWDGFSAAGARPGFVLNGAPGFLGDIGEVPVFTSTQMPDGFVLVNNKQLVQHRVFKAMELKGPYPVYDNGKITSAEEYFAQEYNATESPISEKGAWVRIS
ncbi:MAG: hypothetical protein GY943_16725 [Chloroflexi bacterium]|nr:hypothetical protein [Chloroflexota bacterium]